MNSFRTPLKTRLRRVVACAVLVGTAISIGTLPGTAYGDRTARPIVYVVVLDGLDGDRIDQGKAPFISSLLEGQDANATYFPESQSVMPAETNPNHTAMMTGAFPGSSGIAANAFALYAPLASEDNCVPTGPFDFAALPTETSGESVTCPQVEMTFESMLRQRQGRSRPVTAAVFGKPKLGRIFAGRNFRDDRRDLDYLWAPCSSGTDDDDYCGDVPTNPISGYAVDDATVMDEVIRTIETGVPTNGEPKRPDFTFVNLHQIDTAGHATTPNGLYDSAIGLADDQIERLVSTLKDRGEWDRSVLVLVSDHSMDTTPNKIILTEVITNAGVPEADFLAVDNGSVDFVYLANREDPERFDLLARMRAAILAEPGVADVLYREPNPVDGGKQHTVRRVHGEWRSSGTRTGDLFVLAQPGYAFSEPSGSSNPLPGNHGAPHTADNFLAVAGGSPLIAQGTAVTARPVNADVAPTVMGLFGLAAPPQSRGSFLAPAFNRAALRRSARPQPPRVRVQRGRVLLAPREGEWDVQARDRGEWVFLAQGRSKPKLRLSRRFADGTLVRARARSAAGTKSRWRVSR